MTQKKERMKEWKIEPFPYVSIKRLFYSTPFENAMTIPDNYNVAVHGPDHDRLPKIFFLHTWE